jgi:hypothetical protein
VLVLHDEQHVTPRPIAHPLAKILVPKRWALILAHRHHAS